MLLFLLSDFFVDTRTGCRDRSLRRGVFRRAGLKARQQQRCGHKGRYHRRLSSTLHGLLDLSLAWNRPHRRAFEPRAAGCSSGQQCVMRRHRDPPLKLSKSQARQKDPRRFGALGRRRRRAGGPYDRTQH